MLNELANLRNVINAQCEEIGKIIQEKNEYKLFYENLLISISNSTSNI